MCRKALPLAAAVAALLALATGTARAGTTFTVTNVNYAGPGSLRQAILDANASPGKDTIAFDILPAAPQILFPADVLPAVTDPVRIDGSTQPGYQPGGPPMIDIDSGGSPLLYGLEITAGNSVVNALAIGGFQTGILLDGASKDTVTSSVIGANIPGTSANPNGTGILIRNSYDTIGGTATGAGNLISGNSVDGVQIEGDPASGSGTPTGNAIQGNLIGTTHDGTAALGNGYDGVEIDGGTKNIVGGPLLLGAGNVISGNTGGAGVEVFLGGGNEISSNLIGTSADGLSAIPNFYGVVLGSSSGNLVGRSTGPSFFRGGGNVISGNTGAAMVVKDDSGDLISGNVVGRTGDGSAPLGNVDGFQLGDDANLTVGTEKDPNVIADNVFWGIEVYGSSAGVRISANSIYDNGLDPSHPLDAIGIDLNRDGVTTNDPGDSDTGPNGLQNFPVITSVSHQGGQVVVVGTLNSRPFGTYRLEFFANSACDPSGYGQGETYLGAKTAVADPFGNLTFSVHFPLNPSAPTPIVTATATDQSGNTSEFSACSSGG